MIPRHLLYILVFAFPILIVAFAVVMGGFMLFEATGDAVAGSVFRWLGMAILGLAGIDAVLLLGVLGIQALQTNSPDAEDDSE